MKIVSQTTSFISVALLLHFSVFEVSKNPDFDAYIPPSASSRIPSRTASPIIPQQSTPIKTINLFPGSTTVLNEEPKPKPVVNTTPNFSFINPKALMSSIQTTHE